MNVARSWVSTPPRETESTFAPLVATASPSSARLNRATSSSVPPCTATSVFFDIAWFAILRKMKLASSFMSCHTATGGRGMRFPGTSLKQRRT